MSQQDIGLDQECETEQGYEYVNKMVRDSIAGRKKSGFKDSTRKKTPATIEKIMRNFRNP